jgi:integrase
MPKLNEPKLTHRKDGRAVVHWNGKMYTMGKSGTPEAKIAYHRFCIEIQNRPAYVPPTPENGKAEVTISELAAAFLDYAVVHKAKPNYTHYRILIMDFLVVIFGNMPANDFRPLLLRNLRDELIRSGRFCRRQINDYTRRIRTIFTWAEQMEYVNPGKALLLKSVEALEEGHYGTFDNPDREYVPDDVIRRTLPFLPPILRAMVMLQRLTGMRPSEVFRMTVGSIDRESDAEFWLYTLAKHKTRKKTNRKRILPLRKDIQDLIAPYLDGKKADDAVFCPRQAMKEPAFAGFPGQGRRVATHFARMRTHQKTTITGKSRCT